MIPVFDSNILIDHLNKVPNAWPEIKRYENRYISAVTWIEVLAGSDSEAEEETSRMLLDRFRVIETDHHIREIAAVIRQQKKLRLPDAIILATAQSRNTILITRNTKDFDAGDPSIRVPYTL